MNRVRCKLCGDLLHSTHRHDYVTCSCGAVSVDGGDDYCKLSGDIANMIGVADDGTETPLAGSGTLLDELREESDDDNCQETTVAGGGTLLDELREAAADKAMSVADIVRWWTARARCVRCRHLNVKWSICENEDSPMRGLDSMFTPSEMGCPHFDG